MRLAQELPRRGATIASRVAEILGGELGWDADRSSDRVIAEFLERRAARVLGPAGLSGRTEIPICTTPSQAR